MVGTVAGMDAADLQELRPGKMRRDYLDDMTVVVVKLDGSLCLSVLVSLCPSAP